MRRLTDGFLCVKPRRDGKRVLECLQKSLRIASSCFEEVVSVQLYVDALDKYLYYFEHGVAEVRFGSLNKTRFDSNSTSFFATLPT